MKNPFANLSLFKKKDKDKEASSAPIPKSDKPKKDNFFSKLLKNRLGKASVQGEEILGVERSKTYCSWVCWRYYKKS